ncbi:hypothetical protein V0R50_07885 [Pseudomonas sp. 148P]|uniref:Uncharacterized protein n=1 Tax=Pseudomonas ulcerans TaxID=3115852 RepID=A0ABU7HNR7_9PSED|nr:MULTISPECIES: hypothetical protein [unclassified Pseudomonas]MEE1923640.1 hypothetical protein [Pseudomonas sp. 147P]MEE1933138.1 hypothetical protein [Pseudomonas sp. 148P]
MIEEELEGFQDAGQRSFSVRLALKVEELQEGDNARSAYQEFFKLLKTGALEFRAYTVRLDGSLGVKPQVAPAATSTVLLDAFEGWLDGHQGVKKNSPSDFRAPRSSTGSGFDNPAMLDAFSVLVGASSWVAPVPQSLGLAYVLTIEDTGSDDVVFQPYVGDPSLPASDNAQVDEMDVVFSYPSSAVADSCRSNRAHRPVLGDMLIDPKSGFVQFADDAADQEAYRTLTRLEQRAGSLFTGFFAVTEVQWEAEPLPVQRVRREAWRALATLSTSLDTLLLALTMPHVDPAGFSPRDGGLLGPLLNLLIERLEQKSIGADAPRSVLRNAIRQVIQSRLNPAAAKTDLDLLLAICRPQDQAFASPQSSLYRLLQASVDPKTDWKALENTSLDTLSAELAPLQDAILSEKGFESTVVRLLRHLGGQICIEIHQAVRPFEIRKAVRTLNSIKTLSVAKQSMLLGYDQTVVYVIEKSVLQAYDQSVDDFQALLDTGLNGADAARQSVGKLICDIALHQSKALGIPLKEAVRQLAFWKARLGVAAPTTFAQATRSLLRCCAFLPSYEVFFAKQSDEVPRDLCALKSLGKASRQMQASVLDDLFAPTFARFTPDLAPSPLAISLPLDPVVDDEDLDAFAAAFSGMALGLRHAFDDQIPGPWAYANLADFHHPTVKAEAALGDVLTVQPVPTTINDGRRSLFLHYDGLPLASSAFDDSLPDAGLDPVGKAFFATDYPGSLKKDFEPLPTLAYGARYDVFAHVVGRSGTLPAGMQGEQPWSPAPIPTGDEPPFLTLPYSRRTAIGRTTISDAGATRHLGLIPSGLQPLSADYPRLGLHGDGSLALDLFRQVNGSGALYLSEDEPFRDIHLEDFRYSGPDGGTLSIEVWHGAASHTFTQVLVAGLSQSKRLSIRLEGKVVTVECEGKRDKLPRTPGPVSLWLRVKLTGAEVASVSFVDPAASTQRTAGQGPKDNNLLLLGAPFQGKWRPPFHKEATLRVTFPRVPYSDFVRWIANPKLRGEVFEGLNGETQIKDFLYLLEAANIDRSRDLELGKLLDALLDPAVSSLRLDVVVMDGLMDAPEQLGKLEKLKPQAIRPIKIPSLGKMLNGILNFDKLVKDGQIKEILGQLDRQCRHTLTISSFESGSSQSLSFKDSTLQVPAGACVQLCARPQVESRRFESRVIDERLKELAVGEQGGLVVFEGAKVLVESMPGPLSVPAGNTTGLLASREEWTSLALGLVSYEPVGSARSYTLKAGGTLEAAAKDPKAWRWRQLGAVTVLTQRWRFDGKPIYAWINPKAHDDISPIAPGCASRKLKADGRLARFEQQAFAGRERDGQSSTVNLLPWPAVTTLHTAHWEKPSATVFRHRFTLHSRYTPAFERDTDGQCQAWSDALEQAWLRVAMLAEASRIELTRPQLRALIPLTQSPEEGAGLTPPLMAILQERPFDYGGLADRVIAEIRSGIGYELPAAQENALASVVPADIRKEIGRDPRLAYEPFDQATGQGVLLSVEGPIGLTFESDAVAAPAFPNSALVLDPVSLEIDKEDGSPLKSLDLEEHFLSVGLRRYLHPHWLVSTIKKESSPDFSGNCWIQFPATQGTLTIGQGAGLIKVLEFDASQQCEVTLDWRVLDPTVSLGKRMKLVSLPLVKELAGWQCALLHTPVNDRRAVLAVFLVPPEKLDEERGAGNAPKLLASIEWNLPAGFGWDHLVLEAKDLWSCAVGVSQTTAMHWARTNRNFATVMVAGEKLLETGKSWPVTDLQARLKKTGETEETEGTLEFATLTAPADSLWLRPTQAAQPYPTHTQRHLALLFSEMRSGLGRSLERPTALHMLGAKSLTVTKGSVPDAGNSRVRVIEFETPAIILGHGSDAIPDHYKYGYLDLVAPGVVPAKPENKVLLSLHLRVIASSATRTELTELRLRLRPESATASPGNVLVLRPIAGEELATLDVGLEFDAQGAAKVSKPSQVYALGQRDAIAAEWQGDPWGTDATKGIKGLAMTVESATFKDGNPRELWLEVSMLASSYDDKVGNEEDGNKDDDKNRARDGFNSTLNLDWFFGSDSLPTDTAANADKLRELKEVQARIISVSPGISLTLSE